LLRCQLATHLLPRRLLPLPPLPLLLLLLPCMLLIGRRSCRQPLLLRRRSRVSSSST
jgi:hypothetical protein